MIFNLEHISNVYGNDFIHIPYDSVNDRTGKAQPGKRQFNVHETKKIANWILHHTFNGRRNARVSGQDYGLDIRMPGILGMHVIHAVTKDIIAILKNNRYWEDGEMMEYGDEGGIGLEYMMGHNGSRWNFRIRLAPVTDPTETFSVYIDITPTT